MSKLVFRNTQKEPTARNYSSRSTAPKTDPAWIRNESTIMLYSSIASDPKIDPPTLSPRRPTRRKPRGRPQKRKKNGGLEGKQILTNDKQWPSSVSLYTHRRVTRTRPSWPQVVRDLGSRIPWRAWRRRRRRRRRTWIKRASKMRVRRTTHDSAPDDRQHYYGADRTALLFGFGGGGGERSIKWMVVIAGWHP